MHTCNVLGCRNDYVPPSEWHNINHEFRRMNVDPLTCPLFLLVDNVSKRIWIRELPGPLRNQFLPLVPGPTLQLNSFPQLVVNNQVRMMQNILLAGM